MNESVKTHLVQAVFSEDKTLFTFLRLTTDLTTPKHELIEQVIECVVTKFISSDHLESHGMCNEGNIDGQIAIVDIEFTLSLGNLMDEWNPIVISRCLRH